MIRPQEELANIDILFFRDPLGGEIRRNYLTTFAAGTQEAAAKSSEAFVNLNGPRDDPFWMRTVSMQKNFSSYVGDRFGIHR